MKALLRLDGRTDSGGSPLLMHNERLADPLDPHARSCSEIARKRNKTEADHLELARREFRGGLYENGNGPCLPAWNILRCLQDGAKKHKKGQDVLRGVYPLAEHGDVVYEGPRDPEELWKGHYWLRKGVGVRGSRTMRTRPLFVDWECELPIEVDPTIFDIDTLRNCWTRSGHFEGIGDMRPVYGRFAATIEVIEE